MTTALVLAGGGVTGIAWEIGVLAGLDEAGVPLAFDLVVGTSAGSVAGAQLLSGTPLPDLYARQVSDEHHEIAPLVALPELIEKHPEFIQIALGPTREIAVLLGRQAKDAKTPPLAVRRESVARRLTSEVWPEQPFLITAVDADNGDVVVLDRSSGVELVDAVTASCAIPLLWPPVELLGRTLIDGGARSASHLDLASGHDVVVVLIPIIAAAAAGIAREAEQLRAEGAQVVIISVDDEAFAAMGVNALDPTRRRPAAEHGHRQGLAFDRSLLP